VGSSPILGSKTVTIRLHTAIESKTPATARASKFVYVPGTGLEPAHLAAYAPETYVSTNFTIRARAECFSSNSIAILQCYVNFVVPGTGLEPAQLAPYAPQTYVSTNFTTRANSVKGSKTKKCLIC
jgi:hypothetical protein